MQGVKAKNVSQNIVAIIVKNYQIRKRKGRNVQARVEKGARDGGILGARAYHNNREEEGTRGVLNIFLTFCFFS